MTRLAVGLAGLTAHSVVTAVTGGGEPGSERRSCPLFSVAIGLGLSAQQSSLQAMAAWQRRLAALSDKGHAERLRAEGEATEVLNGVIRAMGGRVVAEIDVTRLVRESSVGLAAETVDALRVQNMRADQFTDRIVARLLLRKQVPQAAAAPPVP